MTKLNSIDDFDEAALFDAAAVRPSVNPLSKYFRLPGLHVSLPTKGAFLPQGALSLTASGDLPVSPMRAADEFLLASPDALQSGYAVEKLIESCVAIATPRLISLPDLPVLMLAIRVATYGETMTMVATCPACSVENELTCHLPTLLQTAKPVPAENPVRLSDEVVAYVRPYTLANGTTLSLAAFEEARRVQALDAAEPPAAAEVRTKAMNDGTARLGRLVYDVLADCILKVVTPEATVSDPAAIAEFVQNIKKPWVAKLNEAVKALNKLGMDRHIPVTCTACQHAWDAEIDLDPASFFADDSSV